MLVATAASSANRVSDENLAKLHIFVLALRRARLKSLPSDRVRRLVDPFCCHVKGMF